MELIASNDFLRGIGEKAKEVYAPPPIVAEALPSVLENTPPPEVDTEESKILDSLAGSDLLPSAIPLQVRTDIYEATMGDSFVAVTLGVARPDAASGNLVGLPGSSPMPSTSLRSPWPPPTASPPPKRRTPTRRRAFSSIREAPASIPAATPCLPGPRDPESGKMGVVRVPLDVPKYEGGTLMLSTVALVKKLEGPKAPPDVGEGKKPPFFLGSFRVVPSLDGVFRQGSDVAWYFQIYNAVPEPATGRPNLSIEYNFLLKQKGEYRQVAAPVIERNRPSQIGAFSFKLIQPTPTQKGWVEGEYKVTVKVTDEVTQSTVSREIPFQVVP